MAGFIDKSLTIVSMIACDLEDCEMQFKRFFFLHIQIDLGNIYFKNM